MIILELGSGNSCRNDEAVVKDMIDGIAETGIDAVLKMQLFTDEPPNVPLDRDVFTFAYNYGQDKGYQVTASVFDASQMVYLMRFDVPFVKIACRKNLYPLANLAHVHGVPSVVSYPGRRQWAETDMVTPLCCVPKYPATIRDYKTAFTADQLKRGISDHTPGFDLYHEFQPEWWEKHVVLERDDDNPDAGPFACLISELGELT